MNIIGYKQIRLMFLFVRLVLNNKTIKAILKHFHSFQA